MLYPQAGLWNKISPLGSGLDISLYLLATMAMFNVSKACANIAFPMVREPNQIYELRLRRRSYGNIGAMSTCQCEAVIHCSTCSMGYDTY